ncbi:MAG: transcription factor E [Promethearchaeota archaeon]
MDELLERFIHQVGGDICVRLAKELEKLKGKEITDQELAERLGEDINTTRKNLYKILDYNLVTYRRTRDKKNGWIIFYFKENFNGYENILIDINNEKIRTWKKELEYEQQNIFYACDAGCTRLTFDKAAEIDFRCPSCDEILNFQDNSQRIENLKRKIEEVEAENKLIMRNKNKGGKSKSSKNR